MRLIFTTVNTGLSRGNEYLSYPALSKSNRTRRVQRINFGRIPISNIKRRTVSILVTRHSNQAMRHRDLPIPGTKRRNGTRRMDRNGSNHALNLDVPIGDIELGLEHVIRRSVRRRRNFPSPAKGGITRRNSMNI